MGDSHRSEHERIEALIEVARRDGPPRDLEGRVLRAATMKRRQVIRRRAAWVGGTLLAAAVALFALGRPNDAPPLDVTPEPSSSRHTSQEDTAPTPRPCEDPAIARGTHPLIDDFEHQEAQSPAFDGRRGVWQYVTDINDDPQGDLSYAPTRLPKGEARPNDERAMHIEAGLLRDWGASLEYLFEPNLCYDASAYAGLRFRAKGPLRVKVAARQVDVIPTEFGGTCERECYISHLTALNLKDGWHTYELPWNEFRRRGYDSKPLDPKRLHSLQIQVESEDTPFELWVDDFGFLERSRARPDPSHPSQHPPAKEIRP